MLDHFPAAFIGMEWKRRTGYKLDWAHPRDLNEKIQWLQCYTDTRSWTRLSDKVLVREYVKEKGLGDMLVPLLGVWKHATDIPFAQLPPVFVLKCNHDSGSTHIIRPGTDLSAVSVQLEQALSRPYGYRHGELHYNRIQPCILAESYLDSGGIPPIDYKVWCFDGKPYCILVCYNRTPQSVCLSVYTLDWQLRPEVSVYSTHYIDGGRLLPRPATLPKMLEAAKVLSQGFPQVRVDFYEVGGKPYFGEMTFTSQAGSMDYFTPAFLKELGQQVQLPL